MGKAKGTKSLRKQMGLGSGETEGCLCLTLVKENRSVDICRCVEIGKIDGQDIEGGKPL